MRRNFVFIVMCACVFFATQCDNVEDMEETVPPEMSEDTEELPGETEESPEVIICFEGPEDYELVKCPSPAKPGKEYNLVGIWKLVLRINGTDTVDCSCEDVVYHFKPDQTLTVSIGDETEEDVAYEYGSYSVPFYPHTPRPNLRMGSSEVYGLVLAKKMYVFPQLDVEREEFVKVYWLFVRID
jgi:hypothetical protein